MMIPTLNSFWSGRELPPLAGICLSSFVEKGHRVILHVYDRPDGVPADVELADAEKILPKSRMFIHKAGVAPFSDMFRYELLARDCGPWIDCDMLCLRPVEQSPYIFGWESQTRINTAILSVPAGSRLLADLRSMVTEPNWIPPWYSFARRQRYKLKYLLHKDYDYRQLNLGTIGPFALTHYARTNGVVHYAAPQEVYYPISYDDAPIMLQRASAVRPYLTEQTRCIHLWNSRLARDLAGHQPDKGSFLAAVLDGTWRDTIARLALEA